MNPKIRILIVNPSAALGGGNTISNNLAVSLDKNIFEIFSFFPEKGLSSEEIKEKINLIFPPKIGFFSIIRFLRHFIKKEKLKIIHLHGTRAAFWGRLAIIGLKDKPKVIYTLHGLHIIRRPLLIKSLLLLLERFLNCWTDVLVCVSEADKNLVLKYEIISSKKIKVIKNGIDVERFQVDQKDIQKLKKELNLEGKFTLTAVGRLHQPKDFSTILKALKLLISQIENVKLLIVGDGPLRRLLEEETKNLNLSDYVEFLGFRNDIPTITNFSDIMILSSNWEALGLVCLEAGACKKPIIASDIEGIREAVIDGKTGYLFKTGSAKDLFEKILELYENEELRKEMGESGYKFVFENFSKERMVKEYQNLYESIL